MLQSSDSETLENKSSFSEDCTSLIGDEQEECCEDSEGGYYEVEQVVDGRLNPLTQTFEYLVRFKGYSESDDLWLPASSFNMPVNYVSVSRYGRKRKSGTDENARAPKQKYTKSFHQTFRSSTHDQGGKSVKASNSRS